MGREKPDNVCNEQKTREKQVRKQSHNSKIRTERTKHGRPSKLVATSKLVSTNPLENPQLKNRERTRNLFWLKRLKVAPFKAREIVLKVFSDTRRGETPENAVNQGTWTTVVWPGDEDG